jgi:hypothetical protein
LQWIAALSAIATLLKSKLGFDKAVERYTKLFVAYSDLTEQFRRLCNSIAVHRCVDDKNRQRAHELFARMNELTQFDDAHPNARLLGKQKGEVEREIPLTSLFWPDCEPVQPPANKPVPPTTS